MKKLNYKENVYRLTDTEEDDSYFGGGIRYGGIEQKGKRTHRHGEQCGDYHVEGV